jgi:multiple sugar transport system substrate-binding protein
VTALRGMTWSHPRGYDPLVACSALWRAKTGVEIAWEQRSLQDFESYPVEDLARRYDLIVIDHPHVGQIVRENCLLPLNRPDRVPDLIKLANQSVGESFSSYRWRGDQWALPIDAAAQVQAWRPDRLAGPVATWDDLLALAKAGRVLVPMRPPHSLMVFYTLAANLGQPAGSLGPVALIDAEFGTEVFERIRTLAGLIDPACFTMDPIAVSERMAVPDAAEHCAPYIYGYVSYARPGFRPAALAFADIPVAGEQGPVGSALGGTGIAVSAFCPATDEAVAFAFWLASADVQCGPYADAGGQPGNAVAWGDAAVNAANGDFYSSTRETLENSWVRPRHDGYMPFQHAAAERINAGLLGKQSGPAVVADLNRLFAESFA